MERINFATFVSMCSKPATWESYLRVIAKLFERNWSYLRKKSLCLDSVLSIHKAHSGLRVSPQEWPWWHFGPSFQNHFLELQHIVDWEVAFRRLAWKTALSLETQQLHLFGKKLLWSWNSVFFLIEFMLCLLGSLLLPWQEKEPTPGWPVDILGS